MGKYGNIDGIATLTNNPNATDNARGTIGRRNGIWAMSKNVGPVSQEDKLQH